MRYNESPLYSPPEPKDYMPLTLGLTALLVAVLLAFTLT